MIAADGVVTLRAPGPGDEEFFRWFGPGATGPNPVACIWVDEGLVGWVDYDTDREHDWLKPGEVNMGYYVFPTARRKGYASRAVELLLGHLGRDTEHTVATLLIHPENAPSLALARRLGFAQKGEVNGEPFFTRDLR